MNAQLVADDRIPFRGLRPLDSRRDLNQVADLIEEAFSGELEPGGLAALRDLRMLSRMGPLVGLMVRSDPALEDVLGGFVWVEESRVVGNVTLQRMDPYGSRWQIANVAVTRDYQRRGIGRALVTAALERIDQRGGNWAVLQVRNDNHVARDLYQRLGFEAIAREIVLELPQVPRQLPAGEPPAELRAYRPDEWRARYDLEQASRSELTHWWRPVTARQFWQSSESRLGEKLWELLGRNRQRRWVVPGAHGLVAYLGVDGRRWQGTHRLQLTLHPRCQEDLAPQMLTFALAYLKDYPRWPVRAELTGDQAGLVEAMRQMGFGTARDLLSMRKKMA